MKAAEIRKLTKAIRLTLGRQIVAGSDSAMIAEANFTVWKQLASQIDPVIGPYGTEALFNRAIHIISKDFPWLTIENPASNDLSRFGNFKQYFELQKPGQAVEASEVLLLTFTELLIVLIGESLTYQLLNPVLVITSLPQERLDD